MVVYEISLLLIYLAIFSLLGWIAEVIFVFVTTRELENRGFLTGPFLPIYGFGSLLLILFVLPFVHNPFLVFVAGVAITTALEYVTHLALDRLLHIELWDYSGEPLNLHGRVCLRNSLLFGVLGLLLIYVLAPLVITWVMSFPMAVTIAVAGVMLGVLIVDATNSVISLALVRPVVDRIRGELLQVHAQIEAEAQEREPSLSPRGRAAERARLRTVGRLGRAYPRAQGTSS